jgi:short-subunit dehydrogenase
MSGTEARHTALVTGASAGLGLAFAHEYARRGADLVLVARRASRLRDIAQLLQTRHDITATVLPANLADPDTPQRLFDQIAERELQIDSLVNNAGFGVPGHLCDVDWQRHRATLEVMTAAPVRLCYLFAPSMKSNRKGWIINVASLSALLPPHAGGTLYYPVKSFLYQFSLALREELRASGVHVTALCPGFTETDFQKAAGGTVESVSFPRRLWSQPENVALAAIRAVDQDKAVCIPGAVNKAIAIAFKLLPSNLGRWVVRS